MTKFTSLLALGVCALASCSKEPEHFRKKLPELTAPVGVEIDSAKLSIVGALPPEFESKTNPATAEKVQLGQTLFHDTRLSKDGKISCNTCHDLGKYGADGKAFSGTAAKGDAPNRNTPTVFDAAGQFAEGWDGRVETVEDEAKQHDLANLYAATSPDAQRLVAALKTAYAPSFKKAFPDDAEAVTVDNAAKALGAFLRKLVTPSKWDDFIKGNKSALSDDEKKGFLKFVEVGCTTCHTGPLVGGVMYQKLGKEKPWPNQSDKGRSRVTKAASDDMMFKVAQLRNVEHTGPYFHDASANTLEEAVKTMASHQLNKELSDDDVRSIVLWLKTLSGNVDPALVKPPEVPGANDQSAGGQKKPVRPAPK